MTIFVVSMSPERALVAQDSACYCSASPGDPWPDVEVSKLHLLPHVNLVIGGCGTVYLFDLVKRHIDRPGVGVGFDMVAEQMTELLNDIRAVMLEGQGNVTPACIERGHTVFLVGWSDLNGRMLCKAWHEGTGGFFVESHVNAWAAIPCDWSPSMREAPTNLQELELMALAAVGVGIRYNEEQSTAFGRSLVLAELGKDYMAVYRRPAPYVVPGLGARVVTR